MATLFQSFRGSGMPKRLLRYALSRLDLLDADALDMDNLDLAIGRNTVFEFRDVGIKLKKLQKLLSLPPTFGLDKAKVLLLRITIPMDFYTSPIIVQVDGVHVRLKVLGDVSKTARTLNTPTQEASVVPNTADLAQSFLETESFSERKQLEDALAAETNDLGASVTMSEDGSEDESPFFGTGQPLSLPGFLADFLQGIVDRTQISINNVVFQLDLEVPAELNSSKLEPVSFQVALGQINVEGITTDDQGGDGGAAQIVHQEGKRHVSLSSIRACLISEAGAFASLTRSPSTASPSLASSPAMTRNPPSRQATFLSQGSFHEPPMVALQESFRERLSDDDEASDSQDYPLGDSEDALAIPYDLSDMEHALDEELEDDLDKQGPLTPRASKYLDSCEFPRSSHLFHSIIESGMTSPMQPRAASDLLEPGVSAEHDNLVHAEQYHETGSSHLASSDLYSEASSSRSPLLSVSASVADLAQSQVYTHEEAESMYMSAFSQTAGPRNILLVDEQASEVPDDMPEDTTQAQEMTVSEGLQHSQVIEAQQNLGNSRDLETRETTDVADVTPIDDVDQPAGTPIELQTEDTRPRTPAMPGAWDDSMDTLPDPLVQSAHESGEPGPVATGKKTTSDDNSTPSPSASGRTSPSRSVRQPPLGPASDRCADDGNATPRGPPKLVKEIMRLHNISIYLPTQHQHIHVHVDSPESLNRLSQSLGQSSIYPQAPGAFSIHSSSSPGKFQPANKEAPDSGKTGALEITLSPIIINFDASIAFLLAVVMEKLLEAVKSDKQPSRQTSVSTRQDSKAAAMPRMQISAEEITVNFLNRLSGLINPSHPHVDFPLINVDEEVLLNMTLNNLKLSCASVSVDTKVSMVASRPSLPKQGDTLTKIELEKFRFGYARGDILSFDGARQMSTSIRDSFLSTGYDIGIEILQSGDTVRTNVETLPLVIQIDLQRLDETFDWFGGLSSFLNMSASMTSSPSPTTKSIQTLSPKPRGVRFDTPIDPKDKSASAQNKINLRVGGALIELVGKDCSVAAETSALKVVSRDEGIGIGCSRLRISGPYLKHSLSDPAISAEIGGMRLEFLMAPKDTDLEKLLELIIPSKVKFDHENDEVMVDTLLRQRRKGSVLRATLDTVNVSVKNIGQLSALPALGEEIAKLAAVAKYLPEDDRPGLLTLTRVQKLSLNCELVPNIGHISCDIRGLEAGQITVPSLIAVAVHGINVRRNRNEELIGSSLLEGAPDSTTNGPVLMVRMIGDEIEPIIKLKLQDLRFEYRVATIMDFLDLGSDATPQDFEASLAASVANLGDQAHTALSGRPATPNAEKSAAPNKPTILDLALRDCVIGLNPYRLPSKMIVALTDAHVEAVLPNTGRTKVSVGVNKASILLTDDAKQIQSMGGQAESPRVRSSSPVSPQVEELCALGFVDICYISSASVVAVVIPDPESETKIEVEVRDDLLVLETCADSTQTLITLANALKPPTPPSKENKYRTKVLPVQDLLASISAEAFGRPEGEYDFDQDFAGAQEMVGSGSEDEFGSGRLLPVDSRFYGSQSAGEELFDATKSMESSQDALMEDTNEGVLLTGFSQSHSELSQSNDDLVIHDNFYDDNTPEEHAAMVWNSNNNSYDRAPANLIHASPVKVSVRDVHVIWNLFDGYDWAGTRDVIAKAVEDVELKATERQSRRSGVQVYEEETDDEETIGDFLFNSIYIEIPSNRDPRDLTRVINEGLNDNATETESVATTAMTMNTTRTARRSHPKSKRLRLHRSKHHKITFELQGVNVDMVMFPAGGVETVSSIDARVQNFDIFDHVPTSTWKKFATYDQDHGEREMGTSMIHIELLNVKPIAELAASEIVLRATVLPLRLHVDQDALDFITRFFEFKDDKVPVHASPSDVPFLQRAEVMDIPVKLDFKPKRVDYGGLRSGHTTEFMNFIVLEESRMVLRHTIIYGVAGFDRLGKTLNDIWMPDVRNNQLPGVVAGLAPVRSLVNIGSGFKDLVEIPLREYRKDGRVIRSISKGAVAFAKTTGTELVKLGAKLAVGTQYALQGAEDMLTQRGQAEGSWEDDDVDPEDKKHISLYADQPAGVLQGIRGGFRSLTRDVNLARDAIIAVPGEVMATQSASGAAKVMWKRAPTIIFRPAVGVTKAIGQTLMGATNALDQDNKRRISEKYKH
ncbi:ATG2 domain protein [Metarhizium robertsii]|uniref:Autophagy-related protein 2 n=2 Tax=Metarhizium robertsii TaxID=568076 RepID=E9ESS3_METRA|nr:ATG C terminal domain-containing protein [Metarhizium robertsii ARSEF 23]EFZ01946.1 ATG C terminal domain-containing protein [Metarhizium robertsii ARSEF 23]EXV02453.1 ATG2 domain protein [Metarhizium robertsii]